MNKKVKITPEFGKVWYGEILRIYEKSNIYVVMPEGYNLPEDTIKVDADYNKIEYID